MELAKRFDALPSAGHDNILAASVEKVNAEVSRATEFPMEPEKQRIIVIRWNAMRELLDFQTAYIEHMRQNRDEILKERGESANA